MVLDGNYLRDIEFNGATFLFSEKAKKRKKQEKVGVFRIMNSDESSEIRLN